MKLSNKLIYVLAIILLVIIVFLLIVFRKRGGIGYYVCNDLLTGNVPRKVLHEFGLHRNNRNWLIYIPCGYTRCEFEIKNINISSRKQMLFMIDGCDNLCSKFRLAQILNSVYSNNASDLVPQSYLSYDPNDLESFWSFYNSKMAVNPYSKFILKNNKQRQTGIYLLRDRKDIEDKINNDKYVLQEYLDDPFTIIGRKINLRYYILVVCTPKGKEVYMHYNGFVYYTANEYSKTSLDFDCNITSGYIDRKIYEENPLTLDDFYKHLANNGYDVEMYIKNVVKTLSKIFNASNYFFGNDIKYRNNTRFQIFGCDVAPGADLSAKIMEFNKGPDLNAKGPRDFEVKYTMVKDAMNLVLKNKLNKGGFMKIWSGGYKN